MNSKVGRNDPCPCGSGKKYKQCCMIKKAEPVRTKKLAAKWLNEPKHTVDLMERTFGSAIASSMQAEKPPELPPEASLPKEENN